MISLTERAGYALSQILTEEDRVTGRIFRLELVEGSKVELMKGTPAEDDVTLKHEGYLVLAVPSELASAVQSLNVDLAPSQNGDGMALVVKTGKRREI